VHKENKVVNKKRLYHKHDTASLNFITGGEAPAFKKISGQSFNDENSTFVLMNH